MQRRVSAETCKRRLRYTLGLIGVVLLWQAARGFVPAAPAAATLETDRGTHGVAHARQRQHRRRDERHDGTGQDAGGYRGANEIDRLRGAPLTWWCSGARNHTL
jgi:hypothetical protein